MRSAETCIHLDDCPYRKLEALPPVAHYTRQTLAIILAGGRGERLGRLTDWRAKPAVPFGGKFRIIDFALSNCVNSGSRRATSLSKTLPPWRRRACRNADKRA